MSVDASEGRLSRRQTFAGRLPIPHDGGAGEGNCRDRSRMRAMVNSRVDQVGDRDLEPSLRGALSLKECWIMTDLSLHRNT